MLRRRSAVSYAEGVLTYRQSTQSYSTVIVQGYQTENFQVHPSDRQRRQSRKKSGVSPPFPLPPLSFPSFTFSSPPLPFLSLPLPFPFFPFRFSASLPFPFPPSLPLEVAPLNPAWGSGERCKPGVRGHSRTWNVAPFGRSCVVSY